MHRTTLCFPVLIAAVCVTSAGGADNNAPGAWPVLGQNLRNTRNQNAEHQIGTQNVKTLAPRWVFTTGSDVSATPTVLDDAVYFPDWSGNLFAVHRNTGQLIWSHKISEYDNVSGSLSRTSPTISGDDLIIGDILNNDDTHNGANVMAVNRQTGRLHWITQVETHPAAIITGPAVVANGVAFVGVSSIEEDLATDPSYPCCSFRGSVVALDAQTGRVLWQTYTVPDNHGQPGGYSGNAVWAPAAIDVGRGLLYVGTGNNYTAPQAVQDCVNHSRRSAQSACIAADDHFDSALALDMRTGHVKWAKRLQGFDIWTVACLTNTNPVACPVPESPDYDMGGSGAILFPRMVVFPQKSGIVWSLDPDTGALLWSSVVGPGGIEGGVEWSAATDDRRIYVPLSNSDNKEYPLINGKTITWGAWSALDAGSGRILWQTAVPDHTQALGAVSVANGVLYAPSFGGNMYALDAATGAVLWTFPSGGTVVDGPSIVDGTVFWGSGYTQPTNGIGNNKVYAFAPAGGGGDESDRNQR
ncbi:MAG TPA: PQQ-binding-like beta-propeller repeat protein [Bryobacteraceae bacterium]|nr:PQQ-binding-like beta-propeller repeat protein [Bryobacteraceae bacterium]